MEKRIPNRTLGSNQTPAPSKPSGNFGKATNSRAKFWRLARKIALMPDILDAFASALEAHGIVGEERNIKLLYLIMTTRLFAKPASCLVRGPAAAGKSELVKSVQRFFPPSAYVERTGMSEKALIHSGESLKHRMLIIYEAAGLGTGRAAYYFRTLLSEGKIRYEVTVSPANGTQVMEKAGPTGLIATTVTDNLDPELESRVLLVPINESKQKIRAVLMSVASGAPSVDEAVLDEWHAFQSWLTCTDTRVEVPFAKTIARLISPTDVKLHRYFWAVKVLVQAHALIHRKQRRMTKSGAVIARVADYKAVCELLKDIFAQGIEAAVPVTVRRVVAAVAKTKMNGTGVSLEQIAAELTVSKSTACRHAQAATRLGYLQNLDGRSGAVAKYVVGEPIPTDTDVLPAAKAVWTAYKADAQAKVKPKAKAAPQKHQPAAA